MRLQYRKCQSSKHPTNLCSRLARACSGSLLFEMSVTAALKVLERCEHSMLNKSSKCLIVEIKHEVMIQSKKKKTTHISLVYTYVCLKIKNKLIAEVTCRAPLTTSMYSHPTSTENLFLSFI